VGDVYKNTVGKLEHHHRFGDVFTTWKLSEATSLAQQYGCGAQVYHP